MIWLCQDCDDRKGGAGGGGDFLGCPSFSLFIFNLFLFMFEVNNK